MIDGRDPLGADVAEPLLELARTHPRPATRADLLAILVRVPLPDHLGARLAVILMDELAVADNSTFPDLARTAVRTGEHAVLVWVRAFAATAGPRRQASLDALSEVRDPEVVVELRRLLRTGAPSERDVARRLLARYGDHAAEAAEADDGPEHVPLALPLPLSLPAPARAPFTGPRAEPDQADDPGPSYHSIFSVVGARCFDLLQQPPPVHMTALPPDRLGSLLMDRLLDSALAPPQNPEPAPAPDGWPPELSAVTAVRLARELNGAYRPDRGALFRRYRLARSGEGPEIAVSAQSLAELAGVGPPVAAVRELAGALLSADPVESADAAAFLRTAIEQASARS